MSYGGQIYKLFFSFCVPSGEDFFNFSVGGFVAESLEVGVLVFVDDGFAIVVEFDAHVHALRVNFYFDKIACYVGDGFGKWAIFGTHLATKFVRACFGQQYIAIGIALHTVEGGAEEWRGACPIACGIYFFFGLEVVNAHQYGICGVLLEFVKVLQHGQMFFANKHSVEINPIFVGAVAPNGYAHDIRRRAKYGFGFVVFD